MINLQMRMYDYLKYGANDEYGQPTIGEEVKQVKMSINFASETIKDNPLYSGATYTGLTVNQDINSDCIILFGDEQLKVLYTNKQGRYIQVFMSRV
jgi:hypothetical protein